WLIVGQAAILAAGCCAAFAVFRRILNDDVAALALTLAFLLNRYTAKTAQYVFHFEVFYPLMLFLLVYAFLSRRPILLVVSRLLTMAIKQDALRPLAGLAIAFLGFFRRPRAPPRRFRSAFRSLCIRMPDTRAIDSCSIDRKSIRRTRTSSMSMSTRENAVTAPLVFSACIS